VTGTRATGGCLCGGVRWELSAPPVSAGYCHCTRCQRRTGSACAATARVEPGSFTLASGEELVRLYDPGDGGYLKAFCSGCGSALWSQHPEDPENRGLRLGSFDEDPGVRPSYHQYVAYAASWETIPEDGLPRYPERRPPA
jgi:hypothetical protein